jgi:hypothetical protein
MYLYMHYKYDRYMIYVCIYIYLFTRICASICVFEFGSIMAIQLPMMIPHDFWDDDPVSGD